MNTRGHARSAVGRIEVVVAIGMLGLAGWLIIPATTRARTAAGREACLTNLGRIGQALQSYLEEHDRRWPYVAKLSSVKLHDPPWPTLPAVLAPYLLDDGQAFHCPADRRTLPSDSSLRERFPTRTTYFETEGTSYEYWMGDAYGGKKIGEESLSRATGFGLGRPDQPLLTDFEPFHTGDDLGSFNTLNADLEPRTTRAKATE